jgi:hypothetical protein
MSQCISQKMRTDIRKGLPVSVCGLKVYPITMDHYEEFMSCREGILLRMRTLPVKYMLKDYFSAVFALELDTVKQTGKGVGIMGKLLRLLELSLRIESPNGKSAFDNAFRYEKVGDDIVVSEIVIVQEDVTVRIKPNDFSLSIRPVIAEMNGLQLPDENENPELVLADEQKREFESRNQKKLKTDISDLIASVAYLSHCSEREIYGWTVREFDARKRAIERDKRYMLYAQAEMSGMVSFKHGNPCPSWMFDVLDDSLGTTALSELDFGGAQQKTQ